MNHRYVYSLHDSQDVVIYVGCSGDPTMRLRRHIDRPWGAEIAGMRVIPCETTEEAKLLERRMIGELRPTYNETGNPNFDRRKRGTRQQQVLDLLMSEGPMTQCQAEHWFRDHGVDNAKSFTGTCLIRLRAKGLVEVVDRIPAKKGPHDSTAVYAATVSEVAA